MYIVYSRQPLVQLSRGTIVGGGWGSRGGQGDSPGEGGEDQGLEMGEGTWGERRVRNGGGLRPHCRVRISKKKKGKCRLSCLTLSIRLL